MEEIWKDIPGYEGYYQVSNLGRVKALEREVLHWRGGLRTYKEKYIKTSKCKKRGYPQCGLCKDGVPKNWTIHVLIAMAFMNHKPNGHTFVIDHIDSDRTNSILSNLRIVDVRYNTSKERISNTGETGVHRVNSGRYISNIGHKGKRYYLGTYDTIEEAQQVYVNKLKQLQHI